MAQIRKFFWVRHLRAEATSHVLHYRAGELRRAGRGLAFWFSPMAAAVAEVPVDDRDLNFIFQGRTRDYQEVTIQGVITYRVMDAAKLADRVDFSINLDSGRYAKQPLEQIAVLLTGIAQQTGLAVIAKGLVQDLLVEGFDGLVAALDAALRENPTLAELGIALETVRIDELKPTKELERALQTPTREGLQQRADEATFQRRALAVEKERAIAENEMQTQVELARREKSLIEQRGQNERQDIEQKAETRRLAVVAEAEDGRIQTSAEAERLKVVTMAKADEQKVLADAKATQERLEAATAADKERIEGAALAERRRLEAAAEAETLRQVGQAQAETTRARGLAEAEKVQAIGEARAQGEQKRLEAYRNLPPEAVFALAAQELAGQLKIDNLTVTPDMLGGLLERAAKLGVAKLEGGEK